MILPGKHVTVSRSLVGVGARVLDVLDRPHTVSALWHRFDEREREIEQGRAVTYDWFVLALDFLYTIGCVEMCDAQITRVKR